MTSSWFKGMGGSVTLGFILKAFYPPDSYSINKEFLCQTLMPHIFKSVRLYPLSPGIQWAGRACKAEDSWDGLAPITPLTQL